MFLYHIPPIQAMIMAQLGAILATTGRFYYIKLSVSLSQCVFRESLMLTSKLNMPKIRELQAPPPMVKTFFRSKTALFRF